MGVTMADGDKTARQNKIARLHEVARDYIISHRIMSHGVNLLDGESLEGFLSVVTRLKIFCRLDVDPEGLLVSVILKKMPPSGFQSRIIKSCRAFEREIAFYSIFSPIVVKILYVRRCCLGRDDFISVPLPNVIVSLQDEKERDDPKTLIALEDLCTFGYRIPRCPSKVRGLDLNHCVVAIRALGRFHALSEGVVTLLPPRVPGWSEIIFNRVDKFFRLNGRLLKLVHRCGKALPWILRCLKRWRVTYRVALVLENLLLASPDDGGGCHGDLLRQVPQLARDAMWYDSDPGEEPSIFYDVVEKRLLAIRRMAGQMDGLPKMAEESGSLGKELERVWSVLKRSVRASRTYWNVINHGDCWINNMLFRYAREGVIETPVDVKFIDLQFARYCHPAVDLLYFLYTSTHRSFREHHFDLLISEYHASLTQTLTQICNDYVPISLGDLKVDLRGQFQPFGVIIGTVFAPYLKLEADAGGEVGRDAHEQFIIDGNSAAALSQFQSDVDFRSFMEDNIRELTEVIYPKGLGFVNPYWM